MKFFFENYIFYNIQLISTINTYSVSIFTITLAFIPLIYMVKNKIYFEEFMEYNKKGFKISLLSSIYSSFINFFISLINVVYQFKILISIMLFLFIIETIFFTIILVVTITFIKKYLKL